MLNNRDDQYEDEDSEYHFSDDEISYEVESETPPNKNAKPAKESFFSRLTGARRMIISLVVFLVLIFIVYKMVAPSSSPSSDQITPVVTNPPSQSQPVVNIQAPPITQVPGNTQTVAPQVAPPVATQSEVKPPQANTINSTSPTATIANRPNEIVPPTTPPSSIPPPPSQTGAAPLQQNGASIPVTTTTGQPVAPLPKVIPVQSTITVPPTQPVIATVPTEADQVTTTSAIQQLHDEYNQKLATFEVQKQAMQDQMKALSTKVDNMQGQLNQILEVITRPAAPNVQAPQAKPVAVPEPAPEPIEVYQSGHDSRLATFTVQAIIPGRAWLKRGNGETVTVAEGDIIRGLGRVTKIDPYDGVVEVNTGNKVVSISYGSGT